MYYGFNLKGQERITYTLKTYGLLKSHEMPWAAVSPDGILELIGPQGPKHILIEYKCPARLRDTDSHPYAKHPHNVPCYYMDQIQGIMGYINKFPYLVGCTKIEGALFVVWQPHQLHITKVPYEPKYYADLESKLEEFYFQTYLPFAVLKYNGLLKENSLDSGSTLILN